MIVIVVRLFITMSVCAGLGLFRGRVLAWTTTGSSMYSSRLDHAQRYRYHGFVSRRRRRLVSTASSVSSEAESPSSSSSSSIEPTRIPRKFIPYPFSYREEKTLRVLSLTNLGFGVCRTTIPKKDNDDDDETATSEWVIFVPNVIPGELVRIRIYRNHKNYSDADLIEVVQASPDRVQEPKCGLSESCGGCQYQHMTIHAQRQWKQRHVEELLQRVGGFTHNNHNNSTTLPPVSPTVGTKHEFHYRSKITPHYDRPTLIIKEGVDYYDNGNNNNDVYYEIGAIGFQEKSSRRLVDVTYCPIATEAINDKLAKVRESKRHEAREGRLTRPTKGATLLLRDTQEGVVTDFNQRVTTTVSGVTFWFQAGNFFQNNPFMVPVMVDHVVTAATKPSTNMATAGGRQQPMTHLIDCYCGSGLFCLTAASSFEMCVGIEVQQNAVQEARENAALNGIDNCAFIAASAEAIFESNNPVVLESRMKDESNASSGLLLVRHFPRDQTVVVVDPPRKGCSEEFLLQLYEYKPQRIVYMSCDPATQARDAKGIVEHGYTITSIQPFDLFPQTRHIESLIVFERQ